MKLLVGYTADARGAEAVELAAALVRTSERPQLELAIVVPEQTPFQAVYPGGDHGYGTVLSAQVDQWAAQALELVPEPIAAKVVARALPSVARGLIELAGETGAQGIVLGGRNRHRAGFFAPGAVASSLLHASPVPVAMSNPAGVQALRRAHGRIGRLTAFIGNRPGAAQVLEHAARSAARLQVPLRVATLVTGPVKETGDGEQVSRSHDFLDDLIRGLDHKAQPEVVTGPSIDAAIDSIGWLDGEVAVFGSSRLAPPRQLFLGAKAQRMLRRLPVPMAVVPNQI